MSMERKVADQGDRLTRSAQVFPVVLRSAHFVERRFLDLRERIQCSDFQRLARTLPTRPVTTVFQIDLRFAIGFLAFNRGLQRDTHHTRKVERFGRLKFAKNVVTMWVIRVRSGGPRVGVFLQSFEFRPLGSSRQIQNRLQQVCLRSQYDQE